MSNPQDPMDDVEVEETGLNLFDDRASLAGSFPRAMWGYDKVTVDAHVRDIEQQLSTLKQLTRHLRQQLREAQLVSGTTDFSRLGAHATGILRAAEAQAKDLVTKAEIEAERIKEEGRRVASDLRANAQTEADEIRMAGMANLRDLRAELDRSIQQTVAAAKTDADAALAAAQRHADAVRTEASQQADNTLKAAGVEADRIRAEADKAAAESVTAARTQIDDLMAKAQLAFDDIRTASESMLAEATKHHEESAARMKAEVEEAAALREQALKDGDDARTKAAREAEATLAAAHRQASMMKDRLEEQYAWRREQLQRETNALLQRKASIVAQLSNLRQLAGEAPLDFPDDDPFEPTPTQDSVPATTDAAPATPEESPTTALPAEDERAAEQPTQVIDVAAVDPDATTVLPTTDK